MRPLFSPQQMQELGQMIQRRMRARLGAEDIRVQKLMSRRDGLTVTEAMCPRCRKEMTRLPKVQNVINWRCEPCEVTYRIVDPKDEINRLTGGRE